MKIVPIAHIESPLKEKFGVPRQSGLAQGLRCRIVFEPEYRNADALRGLEEFDYLWIIWTFSENRVGEFRPLVRPPRLGGNRSMGVFATRSSFRPNGLAISSVRILGIDGECPDAPVIIVDGADLMDGTPIFDIKPYVTYADSHPEARSGFVDNGDWQKLEVVIPVEVSSQLGAEDTEALRGVLSLDPRPRYHDDPGREYGMAFGKYNVRFRVADGRLLVLHLE